MTYKQAYEYIDGCAVYGSVPGLDSIRELCGRLNDPQAKLRFIHIAGTNGKGSTAAYISTALKTAGLRVGRYISPTIQDYLERFDIGGRQMSKAAFAHYIEAIRPVCDAMVSDGLPHPTAFEIETAAAFMFFAEKRCDIVILECGMGGRLDATNIIGGTLLTVFAHIAMDHMQYLGDTIEDIALHKVGIMRRGIPTVTGPQEEEVMRIMAKEAERNDSPILSVTDDVSYSPDEDIEVSYIGDVRCTLKGGSFAIRGRNTVTKWSTPLLGVHQIYNAAVAIEALRTLRASCENERIGALMGGKLREALRHRLKDETIAAGLAATVWPGRLQIVSKRPLVIIDGAHNPDAADSLRQSLDMLIPNRPRLLIMGMLKDKDIKAVAEIMCRDAEMILTVTPYDNPRAMRSIDLAGAVREYNPKVSSLDSVEEAVEIAMLYATEHKDCAIIAFGSLSYMGRMIDIYKGGRNGR